MSHPVYFDTHILAEVPEHMNGLRVLDVGCGQGNLQRLIMSYRHFETSPLILGVDIDVDKVRWSKRYGAYAELLRADARHMPFKNRIFDFVAAIEVIEHVTKKDGYLIITELERITLGKILLTTPNGFNQGFGHRCGWTPGEFRELGFRVRGAGSKLSQGINNKKLSFLLYLLFTPIAHFLPILSHIVIATKSPQKTFAHEQKPRDQVASGCPSKLL